MTTTATHFKVGLLALFAITGIVVAALGLGIRGRTTTVGYHTYFDETVQGLEIGSPVDYRGIRIGSVGRIAIAPDHRYIDVRLDIEEGTARNLQLVRYRPELRAQLSSQGITGVKLVDLDWAPSSPPPELSFAPAVRYIASRPSLLQIIGSEAEALGREASPLIARTSEALDKLGRVLDDIHGNDLAGRIGNLVDTTQTAVVAVRVAVRDFASAHVPAKTAAAIDELAARAKVVLERLDGLGELVAKAGKALDSFGGLGRSATGRTDELAETVRSIGEAARSFRELIDELQRTPEMLVKGRARRHEP